MARCSPELSPRQTMSHYLPPGKWRNDQTAWYKQRNPAHLTPQPHALRLPIFQTTCRAGQLSFTHFLLDDPAPSIQIHTEGEPHISQDLFDLVQGLAAKVLCLQHLSL